MRSCWEDEEGRNLAWESDKNALYENSHVNEGI